MKKSAILGVYAITCGDSDNVYMVERSEILEHVFQNTNVPSTSKQIQTIQIIY